MSDAFMMPCTTQTCIISCALLIVSNGILRDAEADLIRAGWVEKAIIFPQQLEIHAKLDTGAKVSSINAANIEKSIEDEKSWARFKITNRNNETIVIKAPILRYAKIKRHYGDSQTRPVIELDLCVGTVRKTAEVNLVDRKGLNYQLLIGRNFLKESFLVDSGSSYTLSPECRD